MKALRYVTASLILFIALNAFAGGFYAFQGAENVPLEWLQGSPFKNYFIPGLFLFIVIGGACLVTSIGLFRSATWSGMAGMICGALLATWIIIQLLVFSYVSWMQPAIFFSGIFAAIASWYILKFQKA